MLAGISIGCRTLEFDQLLVENGHDRNYADFVVRARVCRVRYDDDRRVHSGLPWRIDHLNRPKPGPSSPRRARLYP